MIFGKRCEDAEAVRDKKAMAFTDIMIDSLYRMAMSKTNGGTR